MKRTNRGFQRCLWWASAALAFALGCPGGDEGDTPASPNQRLQQSATSLVLAGSQAQTAMLEGFRIASADFGADPATTLPDISTKDAFDAQLQIASSQQADIMLATWRTAREAEHLSETSVAAGALSDSPVGVQQQALLCGGLCLTAAATLVTVGVPLFVGIGNMVDDRFAGLRSKIENANPATMQVVREHFGLPADATPQDALRTMDNLHPRERIQTLKSLEDRLLDAAETDADVQAPEANDIRQGIADAARTGGRTAIKTIVNGSTQVTGGELIKETSRVLGASERGAELVDATLSVTGEVLDAPSTPLNVVGALVDSDDTRSQSLPSGPSDAAEDENLPSTLEQAESVLADDQATGRQIDEAAERLARDIVESAPEQFSPSTGPDGSVQIRIPGLVQITNAEGIRFGESFEVIVNGPANLLLFGDEFDVQDLGEVDTDTPIDVEITMPEVPADDEGSAGATSTSSGACGALEDKLRSCGLIGSGRVQCPDDGRIELSCLIRCMADASCTALEDFMCWRTGDLTNCGHECGTTYTCPDGSQIPQTYLCDLDDDCGDGADEAGCNYFTCGDGTVIESWYVCDNDPATDCQDGSDEAGCAEYICNY